MNRLLLIILCFYPFILRGAPSEYKEPSEVTATEGLPSNLVNQSVCVISGEYCASVTDAVLPGPESFVVQRHYGSHSKGTFGRSWTFNFRDHLILGDAVYKGSEPIWIIAMRQPSGTQLDYIYPRSKKALDKKDLAFQLLIPKGLTNGAHGLSGRTNLKNQKVNFYPDEEKIVSVSASGNRRTFVKSGRTEEGWTICRQKSEEKINGSKYTFHSEKGKGSLINCKGAKSGDFFSSVRFKPSSRSEKTTIVTNDGREINYSFQTHKYRIRDKSPTHEDTTHITENYLIEVDTPYAPADHYEYKQKASTKELQMVCKKKPEGRFTEISYYKKGKNRIGGGVEEITIDKKDDFRLDRVKKLLAPVGHDRTPIATHRFVYHGKIKKDSTGRKEHLEGSTDVYDAYSHLTTYHYDAAHRLSCITRHTGTSSYQPYSKERYVWDGEGNLTGKVITDGRRGVQSARYFTYDAFGNVLVSKLCGKLTGLPSPDVILHASRYPVENGYECDQTTYRYSEDGLNLLLSETDSSGKTILYEYVKGTDHVKATFVKYNGDIQLREFNVYDKNYTLIKKVTDDGKTTSEKDLTGVTERHCKRITPRQTLPLGLPESIDESYLDLATGRETLLQSSRMVYSPEGYLLKQEVLDGNRQLAYTIHHEYDLHGNLIATTDAAGVTTRKKYDANDNLIFEQNSASDFYLQNTYDFANRLLLQEEIHANGEHFTTSHTYDYVGNCLATVDPYGQETRQTFDDLGRITCITSPSVLDENGQSVTPQITKTYNCVGQAICVTDAKGNSTQSEYNSRGQPTKIIYPDGSCEQYVYSCNGQIAQKIAKNGVQTRYIRDPLGRTEEEALYSPEGHLLKKLQHTYNAFHLLQTIEVDGTVVSYHYDGAGRLDTVEKNGQKQQNIYDSLSRIIETRSWFGDQPHEYQSNCKKYDVLNRVIEESIQEADGTILQLTSYAYDVRGNIIFTQTGEQKTWKEYNSYNQPVKITNALGHETHTTYNHHFLNEQGQRVLQSITTDPLGYQIVHTHDTLQRLVEVSRYNPFHLQVSRQRMAYDLCGNHCRTYEDVIVDEKCQKSIETVYHYTTDRQVTACIEAVKTPEQKISRTNYNSLGQKVSHTKADGTTLTYTYDELGRVQSLQSSDGTISYEYAYDLRDQLTRITDLCAGEVTERTYDATGQLTQETLGNGLQIAYDYDKMGRARFVHLPDQTAIEYRYNAAYLTEIHRLNQGQRLYSYKEEEHTLAGQVTKMLLPGAVGKLEQQFDALGHCISLQSAHFTQTIPADGFDAAGNLLAFRTQGTSYTFTYDDYYHLKSESGHVNHTYAFDSVSNRTQKDEEKQEHNSLNQIVHKANDQFVYDLNGNMIQRTRGNRTTHYTYDALDRLTSLAQNGQVTRYGYDPFNRRLWKKESGKEDCLYVYQGQEEIGSWVEGFQELRLLGTNKRSPMVALEVKNVPYVPIHDLSGNVACLVDLEGNVAERYRYTAFGEREISNSEGEELAQSAIGNPWQYASKRVDEESGLIAFGLRYYEPGIGRWITPDPVGYADGSNLYAYVHNSPLLYFDSYGLSTDQDLADFCWPSDRVMDNCSYDIWHHSEEKGFLYESNGIRHFSIEDELNAEHIKEYGYPHSITASYSLNDGFINPVTNEPFQLKESADKRIIFIGGILTDQAQFEKNLTYLGTLSEYNIVGISCPSWGIQQDVKCYMMAIRHFIAYEGVRKLQAEWNDFFANACPTATCLTLPYSRGAVYARNALMCYPEELRNRIEIRCIAPGGFIDKYLCHSVIHYESSKDYVTHLDREGRKRCKNTIVTLQPVGGFFETGLIDHNLTNMTYKKPLSTVLETYNNK